MNFLKKFFPFSFMFETNKQFAWTIVLYVAVNTVLSILFTFLAKIPLVGWVFAVTNSATYLYCISGVVFAILKKVGVLKDC